jgi:monovalent cation:H+ antiporter-2, CPA2 family
MILRIVMFDDVFLAVYPSFRSGLLLSEAASLSGLIVSALLAPGYMLLIFLLGQ